jgi:ABC-type multidrug transport system ATPase subunit
MSDNDPSPMDEATIYKHITQDAFNIDIEQSAVDDSQLMNDTVQNFLWKEVTVTVKDHKTKQPKAILNGVDGIVEAGTASISPNLERIQSHIRLGEICALMGPSGCGKTTLLNVLAHRDAATGAMVEGQTLVNGSSASLGAFRRFSSYVEQEDALIGSLTVRETLHFAARLAHKK